MQITTFNDDSVLNKLLDYPSLVDPGKVLRPPLFQPIFPHKNSPYEERKIHSKFAGNIVVIYALVPKSSPWRGNQRPEDSTSKYTPFICKVEALDVKDYVKHKENQNVSFTGSAGSGKSNLSRVFLSQFDDQQRIVFSFKPHDHALRIRGIERRDARKHLPPTFKDSDAFAEAYFTTFFDERTTQGIQLQPTRAVLVELAEETQAAEKSDWDTLFKILKDKRAKAPKNEQATLDAIYRNLRVIATQQAKTGEPIDQQTSVALDFSTLTNTQARTFYAELMLRQLWNDLSVTPPRRRNITICIDEARRVTSKPFSIVHKMSQEIRHIGRLWVITQNLTDIHGESRTNYATKIAFRSGDQDLKLYVDREILHDALTRLRPFQFIDLEFPRFTEYVPMFQYKPIPSEENEPTPEPEPAELQAGGQTEGKDDSPDKVAEEPQKRLEVIVSEQEIKPLMPNYWTPILRQTAKKHPETNLNDLKFSVSQVLKRIKAGRIELDEHQDQPYHSFYYLRGENISQLHIYMQSRAKNILGQLFKLKYEAPKGAFSNPDLEYVNDNDQPILEVEVETGLANSNLRRLEERITRALDNDTKVIVVVPNEDQSAKYTKNLLEFILKHRDKISVVTLRELRLWVKEVKAGQQAQSYDDLGPEKQVQGEPATNEEGIPVER